MSATLLNEYGMVWYDICGRQLLRIHLETNVVLSQMYEVSHFVRNDPNTPTFDQIIAKCK